MNNENKALKELWDEHRARTNETQITAAAKLNMKQAALSQYMSGSLNLNALFILRISRLMGVNPSLIRPSMDSIFGNKKGNKLLNQIDQVITAIKGSNE